MIRTLIAATLIAGCCIAVVHPCEAQLDSGKASRAAAHTPSQSASEAARAASESTPQPAPAALLDWAKGQAIALETIEPGGDTADLEALEKLVSDARIVLMGDSRHDAREQWMLKHRIIEYLVKNMGFSVLAMEESLPCTSALNECLLGKRDDLGAALSDFGGWYLWDAEELLALMSTLRAHNAAKSTKRPVRVYGIDISDGGRRGVENALAFLKRIDANSAERLRNAIDLSAFSENFWPQTIQNYGALTPEAIESLGSGLSYLVSTLTEHKDKLIGEGGKIEYEWALRQAIVARGVHDMVVALMAGSYLDGGKVREAAMVENIKWLMDVVAPGEKMIIWAHNFHVSRTPLYVEIPGRPAMTITPLGHLLAVELDEPTVTIGFSFERGTESSGLEPASEDWVDGVMGKVGPDAFLLDLRAAPKEGPIHEWLYADQSMRGEGGKAVLPPAKAFDIVAFVRQVGPITMTERAVARLEALGMR